MPFKYQASKPVYMVLCGTPEKVLYGTVLSMLAKISVNRFYPFNVKVTNYIAWFLYIIASCFAKMGYINESERPRSEPAHV